MRRLAVFAIALACLPWFANPLSAQEDPPTQEDASPANPVVPVEPELVFEREVFMYPQFSRRNPFAVLVASRSGPRFEQIRLRMIIHASSPRGSVALLGVGEGSDQPQDANAATSRDQTRRVRVGERWGNVTILEIRQQEILVQVEEFGLTEQRIMRLPARAARARSVGAQGGS